MEQSKIIFLYNKKNSSNFYFMNIRRMTIIRFTKILHLSKRIEKKFLKLENKLKDIYMWFENKLKGYLCILYIHRYFRVELKIYNVNLIDTGGVWPSNLLPCCQVLFVGHFIFDKYVWVFSLYNKEYFDFGRLMIHHFNVEEDNNSSWLIRWWS